MSVFLQPKREKMTRLGQKTVFFIKTSGFFFFFFTFLLGSKGRGAPRSSPGYLGAPQACTSTPTAGVPMQAIGEDDRVRNGHRIVQL